MTAAVAGALAALGACSLRAPRVTEPICSSNDQCGSGQVCFAGTCRAPATALSSVVLEVSPPASSPWSPVQVAFDAKATAVATLDLPLASRLQGTLVQQADPDGGTGAADGGVPVAGAVLELRDNAPLLPDRPFTFTAQTDSNGAFSFRLPQAAWGLRIVPPSPLPPTELPAAPGSGQGVQLQLPAPSSLARITGTLLSAGAPLAAARVTPIDKKGTALGTASTTDAAGRFQLLLPPPPVEYALRIGEPLDAGTPGTSAPIPAFSDDGAVFHTASTSSTTLDVEVGALPAAATLSGRVLGPGQAPLSGARVVAMSEDPVGWTLTRTTQTAADGTFSLPLRAGRYVVQAAPALDASQPALSPELQVQLDAVGATVQLTCPPKVTATGRVLRAGGRSLGQGATVNAVRLPERLVGSRAATALPTDANGLYTLTGDPGTYRVEVVPPPSSGEPRQIAYLELTPLQGSQANPLADLVLAPPLTIAGMVHGPSGNSSAPVTGASVQAFIPGASGGPSVLIGTAVTDATGKYQLVLPDVSQLAAQAPR